MAKTTVATGDEIPLGKVRKLSVRNFRAIGPNTVEVDLDTIVVLVGPNNAGKSSILRAYEVAMGEGSAAGKLSEQDFPNGSIDEANLPTIELETEVVGDPPAKKWIIEVDGRKVVRERWQWKGPGKGERQGWNVELGDWDTSKPWGFAGVANARRPQPHAVQAFDNPEKQAAQIDQIVLSLIEERAKAVPAESGDGLEFDRLSEAIRALQTKVLASAQADIEDIEKQLTEMLAGVFAKHAVKFDPAIAELEQFKLFAGNAMRVGPSDGYMSPVSLQGSGARRTLLWSVLRIVSERDQNGTGRPHLLLIDEPELCLHPSAVREACRVLYDLADKAGWQVMVTTHHPAFIDLARDNETIVRVERNAAGEVQGTTLFKPATAQLSTDDKQNLKLLNIWDPYVAEFFFCPRVVVVEGDTEFSAFRLIVEELRALGDGSPIPQALLRDVVIVRARGKATIVSLCKILNHFGTGYSVLHDLDSEFIDVKCKETGGIKRQKNGAWTTNANILAAVQTAPDPTRINLVCSEPDFEQAYLGYTSSSEKPATAVRALQQAGSGRDAVIALLYALLDHAQPLPHGAARTSDRLSANDLQPDGAPAAEIVA